MSGVALLLLVCKELVHVELEPGARMGWSHIGRHLPRGVDLWASNADVHQVTGKVVHRRMHVTWSRRGKECVSE